MQGNRGKFGAATLALAWLLGNLAPSTFATRIALALLVFMVIWAIWPKMIYGSIARIPAITSLLKSFESLIERPFAKGLTRKQELRLAQLAAIFDREIDEVIRTGAHDLALIERAEKSATEIADWLKSNVGELAAQRFEGAQRAVASFSGMASSNAPRYSKLAGQQAALQRITEQV